MIRLHGVRKDYEGVQALRKVDLEVREGEVFGLLGPNGAGKTTTIRMLVGLLRPTEGRVEVAGFDLATQPTEAKRRLGYVPDRPYIYDNLSGDEYLEFVGGLWGLPPEACRERGRALLTRFRMADAAERIIEGYSHGMKQKLALAAAFLHDPPLLVIDEPMVGLDPHAARELKALMRETADAGRTVLLSTHQLEVAEAVCDRIGLIHEGVLAACGTMDELRAEAAAEGSSLEEVFLKLTEEEAAGEAEGLSPEARRALQDDPA